MQTNHKVKKIVFITSKNHSGPKDQQEEQADQEEMAETEDRADAGDASSVIDGTQIFQGEADEDAKEKVWQYLKENRDVLKQNGIRLKDAMRGTVQIVGDNSYIVEVGEYFIFANLRDDIIGVDLMSNIRGNSEDDPVSELCTAITVSRDVLDKYGISADDLVRAISDGTVSYEQKASHLYEIDYGSYQITVDTLQDKAEVK